MLRTTALIAALTAGVAFAAPAYADSSRDLSSAVDGYLAGHRADAALVGGPGSAGYDSGFWIRGGDFSLKINLTLQARFEAFDWDKFEPGVGGVSGRGGDLSGFSLPRALVKFSGTAPCNTCYYVEFDFGHYGSDVLEREEFSGPGEEFLGGVSQSYNFENTREAWIEWCSGAALNFRMGQIKTPNTRQLMTAPELQQFVDISLASVATGYLMPGYTDRNRDHGFMVHGALGCKGEWSYMAAVTNGDSGDSIRNVLDDRTDDNLALSGRVNWAFLAPTYYEEGALRQSTCNWYGEVGAWAFYHVERTDGPHVPVFDELVWGVDVALGYGGFSFTGAFTMGTLGDVVFTGSDLDATTVLLQMGFLFPGTAWEIAARYSSLSVEGGTQDATLTEIAGVVNYYLNGHANKLSLDVTLLDPGDDAIGIPDLYTGLQFVEAGDTGLLIRFQWQLTL